jgi:antagonist of KipI
MSASARATGGPIEVLAPGTLTTVQDRGRPGLRALGIGAGGAADAHSALLANLLVGNADDCAVLEITLAGPRLRFGTGARIALAGADIAARCGGTDIPGWRPIDLPAGSELVLGACRRGARAYLAVQGGFDVAPVLGSRATDLRGGFGGVHGRALAAGDRLRCGSGNGNGPVDPAAVTIAPWWIDPAPDMDLSVPAVAALLPATAGLDAPSQAALVDTAWRVAPASNRIGLRLQGPALALAQDWTLPSEPVLPGTVQLPPDGQPIVLLGDCGTIGGYPRIGHVASVDLPRLAQLRPGETMRFVPAALAEADRRACARNARVARIALAIQARNQRPHA